MNHKERFKAVFNGQKADRIPVYFFGTWLETKARWKSEGLADIEPVNSVIGPQVPGMDPDWENNLWNCQRLIKAYIFGDIQPEILEETDEYVVHRNGLGSIVKDRKTGSSIPHVIEYGLKPVRESWDKFKNFLNPNHPGIFNDNWEQRAEALNKEDRVLAFMGGSLYGWLRDFMGIESISLLMYDDPDLFDEMVCYMADFFMDVFDPALKKVHFDLVYIFEDCCGANGPLFSPAIYKSIFDKHYKRLLRFYKDNGVSLALIDSDGMVEPFIPLWLDSGFDIVFPIEVGTWKASPASLRKKYGSRLKMMGGVDKHVIAKGESAIREHLLELKPVVNEGGYIPLPDHRISPECSYREFLTYIRIFNEVFNK